MNDAVLRKVLEGVRTGKITGQEADAFLAQYGTTLAKIRRQFEELPPLPTGPHTTHSFGHTFMMLLPVLLFALGALWLAGMQEGITGFSVTEVSGANITHTEFSVGQNITALHISGTLYGEGNATVHFDTGTQLLLVGIIRSDTGTPRTDRPSYQPGENVNVEHAPENASYYLDDGTANIAVNLPFPAPESDQELLIIANESGQLATYRLAVRIGDYPRMTAFSGLCAETCTMPSANGTLIVTTGGGATIDITATGTASAANSPPVLAVPYSPVTMDGITTIDLAGHFTDADGDELLYSVGSSTVADTSLNGTLLTLTPTAAGTDTVYIYASDLHELVQASMRITVTGVQAKTRENVTGNKSSQDTRNETTAVQNETQPTQHPANDTVLDCSASNPNERPIDCLTQQGAKYFEEDLYWESVDRTPAARISPVGNILIRGDIIEHSTASADGAVFSIGYTDGDLTFRPTIWVDAGGNLHLRGTLYEEDQQQDAPPGSYAVMNRRGVLLAYADRTAGDLHIRGNIIPYRRNIG